MRVTESPQAAAIYGLIQKQFSGNPTAQTAIHRAYFDAVAALRSGDPWVFDLRSELIRYCYCLYFAPLRIHFYQRNDDHLVIVNFEVSD